MEIDDLEQFHSETGPSHTEAESNIEADDDDDFTIDKVLRSVENAWLNEKAAPELLPNANELIEILLQQISYLESNLQKIDKKDIRYNIHNMEISRIRFMISSYLRKRIEKIENYAIYLLSEDNKRDPEDRYMTPAEQKFAQEFVANMESLFSNVALKHIPERIGKFEINKMTMKPNMSKHVFVKSNKEIKGIFISGIEQEVDFLEGSQHIIQYNAVERLVKDNKVQLI